MTIRWKNGVDDIPVAVECTTVGYPHVDAEGETQYENTHFDTEEQAWERGRRESLAGLSLLGADIERLEGELRVKREQAGHAAVAWHHFSRAHERWKREQEPAT